MLKAFIDRHHPEACKGVRSICGLAVWGGDFVRLLGERQFLARWKDIRDDIDHDKTTTRQTKTILHGLWSLIMTGFPSATLLFTLTSR